MVDPTARRLARPALHDDDEGDDSPKSQTSRIATDVLKKDRTILISEVVSPKLTARITRELLWLDAMSNDPIKILINTPGGSADDGFAIHDMIKFVKSPVTNICVGLNASAGTIILLAAAKERRLALPNARIMIHQPSGGARGSASDVEITAEEIIKLRRRANELIASACGRSVDDVKNDTDRDKWLSPEEAKEYGLVSKVITAKAELE